MLICADQPDHCFETKKWKFCFLRLVGRVTTGNFDVGWLIRIGFEFESGFWNPKDLYLSNDPFMIQTRNGPKAARHDTVWF